MNPEIARFVRRFGTFLLMAIPVYLLLLLLWGRFAPPVANLNYRIASYGHMYSRLRDVRTEGPVDVLIAGSSHAYRGFDPRLFEAHGLKAFNLGSSAQTPRQTELLLDRYLEGLQPQWLILEVYPASYTLDGVESTLDVLANDLIDAGMRRLVWELPNAKVWNTYVYAVLSRALGGGFPTVQEPAGRDGDRYIAGTGFVERAGFYYRFDPVEPRRWTYKEETFEALDRILQKAQERHIRVWLVEAPITRAMYESYGPQPEFVRQMELRASFTDFNLRLSLNDSLHFYDSDHLNQDGVEVFNAALLSAFDTLRSAP